MENYSIKLKFLAPTFILVAFGTTAAALLFRWVFTINSEILLIKEEVFSIWLPLILPWFPIIIWLRPKLRILRFKHDNGSFLFQMIAWGTMIGMLMTSNGYLKTSTGRLAEVQTIDILENEESRYLSIEEIKLNQELGSAHTEFSTSGKYNQHLNLDSYFVYPFETSNKGYKYWYGVKFHKQIGNRLSPEKKESLYHQFFEQSLKDFESYKFSEPNYFEILPHSVDREGFERAIEKLQIKTLDKPIIITPREGSYADRNGRKLEWTFGSFGIGFCVFLLVLIFPKYHKAEHRRQLKGIKPKSDELIDMIKFLIPKGDHYATSILLDINILIFLLMIFSGIHIISPNGLELLDWGANRRSETTNGDWWRLITSMFLHGGIMHLLLNIYGLVIAALFIEPIFGRVKYLILYLVSGICGSLTSVFWYENTISVGASGAIFGLYGAILGLLLTSAFPQDGKKGILIFIGPYVAINLLFGLIGGIDNAAHIGGLITGALLGIILYVSDKKA